MQIDDKQNEEISNDLHDHVVVPQIGVRAAEMKLRMAENSFLLFSIY